MANVRERNQKRVIVELKRRNKAGTPLNSGANRGDWLYAAAARYFGSWGEAVVAAGFDYSSVKIRPMNEDEVLEQLRELSARGDSLLAMNHRKLREPAARLFGSWEKAILASGCERPQRRKWTQETVMKVIREDLSNGESLNAGAVIARNEGLYRAGRQLFGSWGRAFDTATATGTRPVRSAISARSVRLLRRQLGIDQEEFAKIVGVLAKTVAKWEIGGLSTSAYGYIPVRKLMKEPGSAA